MLELFIDPYEDEIISNFFARYHYYSGNIDRNDTLEELCGERNFMAFKLFPSRLSYFEANVNNKKYSADYMIYKHTPFPLYSTFMNKAKQEQAVKYMKGREADKVKIITGSMQKRNNRLNIYRYCPICVRNDIDKYGEAYFHREHQVEGILVCSKHECKLLNYHKEYTGEAEFNRLEYQNVLGDMKILFYPKDISNKLVLIAKSVNYIINLPYLKYYREDIMDKLYYNLEKRNLLCVSGIVRQKKLVEEITNYYGKGLFKELGLRTDESINQCFKSIFSKSRVVINPIATIILILFLCNGNISNFFKEKDLIDMIPYGIGPWPCLNPVCVNYRKKTIFKVKVENSYKSRVPTATFRCNTCGYIYRRKGYDENINDIYRKDKVLEFGPIWIDEFKKSINSSMMKKDIIKKFEVYERFIDYYKKTGKLINRSYATKQGKVINHYEEYTNKVLQYIEKNKGCKKSEVIKNMSKEIGWIRYNFPEWIDENLPNAEIVKRKYVKKDYKRLDNDILCEVKKICSKILKENMNRRITITLIEKIAHKKINYKLDKLPKTKSYLNKVLEDVNTYSVRKVRRYCEELIKKDIYLSKNDIIKKAGISRLLTSEQCKRNIDEIIEKYIFYMVDSN